MAPNSKYVELKRYHEYFCNPHPRPSLLYVIESAPEEELCDCHLLAFRTLHAHKGPHMHFVKAEK